MMRRPPRSTLFPHDALPISCSVRRAPFNASWVVCATPRASRSEEHTSELQSPYDLVYRLLLEKKNQHYKPPMNSAYHHGRGGVKRLCNDFRQINDSKPAVFR